MHSLRSLITIAGILLLVLGSASCSRRRGAQAKKDYNRPLAEGELGFVELPPERWPHLSLVQTDRAGLEAGIDQSLSYLQAPSSQLYFPRGPITHDMVQRGLTRFREILATRPSDEELNRVLKRDFRCFASKGYDGSGVVLFTGYLTPIIDARLEPDARFKYPIHRRPQDLVNTGDSKEIQLQKQADGSTRPYPTRALLDASGALKGTELAWFEDPFWPLLIEVQGSAKLRLANGGMMEVGYDGTNGHPYVSPRGELVKDGKIPEEGTLPEVIAYFRGHPQDVAKYAQRNPRKIFFKEGHGGPFGCLGRKVTQDVSIATDMNTKPQKDIFPRASLCFADTRLGQQERSAGYRAFRLDQDTGGAIRAPGRADLYFGEGEIDTSKAWRSAGQQKAEGALYFFTAK